jgi:Flp pilus assembly CpaF family ATPase
MDITLTAIEGSAVRQASAPHPRRPIDATCGEIPVSELRSLVRRLADSVGHSVAQRAQEQAAAGRALSGDAEKVASVTNVHRELDDHNRVRVAAGRPPLSEAAREAVIDAVIAHVYGLGELELVWTHPDVENIDVNGPDQVWVTFVGGEKVRWTPIANDQDELVELIRRAARRLGHNEAEFDARHPQLDLQLPDGSRLFAVFGGDSGAGIATQPTMCIRRHRHLDVTTDDLVRLGLLPAAAADFVVAAFRAGENLIVAGDHNAGKTTFLRAICLDAIAPHQRVVTVEAYITELGLHASGRLPNVVALYSRPPSAEGEGEVTVADLIRRATRRLNPTRVIVGEVLGDEVGPVLDVFSGSTRGSGCTIHARSARGAVRRFEQYGLGAVPPVPVEAINYGLAEASPIIVHLAGDESVAGQLHRACTSIVEVTGLEAGRVSTTELWRRGGHGRLEPAHALSNARRERMERSGWDWRTQGWVVG